MNPETQSNLPVAETLPAPEVLNITNLEELNGVLSQYSIDTFNWTKGSDQLLKEIKDGETELKVVDGKLERHTNTALITVISPDGLSKLVEDRQEIKPVVNENDEVIEEGYTKRRGLTELAEKFKAGEEPMGVARRALTEELGYPKGSTVFDEVTIRPLPVLVDNKAPKSAYQGLTTVNNLSRFLVRMPEELYREDGYTEDQPKKINYMEWKRIKDIQQKARDKNPDGETVSLSQATLNNQTMDNYVAGDENAEETLRAQGLIE